MRCRAVLTLVLLVACSLSLACRKGEADTSDDTSASGARSATVGARTASGAHSPGRVEDFVAAYVAAINARDTAARARLIHPACVACMSADNRDFYDAMLWARKDSLPQACAKVPVQQLAAGKLGADITGADGQSCTVSVKAVPADESPFFEGMLTYPVRPTHQLQIELRELENNALKMDIKQLYLIHDGDSWYEVVPCPTPEALRRFRERQKNQKKQ